MYLSKLSVVNFAAGIMSKHHLQEAMTGHNEFNVRWKWMRDGKRWTIVDYTCDYPL